MEHPRNPYPTVDIIIRLTDGGIVLVQRKNPPPGWAIPGGFVDYGESVENAAVREAMEETGLEVELIDLLGVYSSPDRDPRFHTISVVFTAEASGEPRAGDDAKDIGIFREGEMPELAFDHGQIIQDYLEFIRTGKRPCSRGSTTRGKSDEGK
ncbi:MAG: NUDIX hydrolase [Deltaproteobacteria bacterium]|nr:NUDIX hydrolase [Deltaproteobacteria bacterium]